jgi:hypothetical protein
MSIGSASPTAPYVDMGKGHQDMGPLAHAPPLSAPYSGIVTTTRIRVLLCDDHELVRRGLHALLGWEVISLL